METLSQCNCCGSNRIHFRYSQPDALFYPDEWFDINQCEECGLGFVNPRPKLEEMDKYYPARFYDTFQENAAHHRRYSRQAAFLPTLRAHSSGQRYKLLDIGCAKGGFPRYMKSLGWDAEGVEIGANAESSPDIPVHRKPLDRCNLPSEHYDAITAWAVFEHLHDPQAYFQEVSRILKKGGSFVFLVTNFESLSSYGLFREDIPRHLHLFTEKSVKKYLSDNGLKLVKRNYSKQIYGMIPANILFYLYNRIRGESLMWKDLPANRTTYLTRNNLHPNARSAFKFFISNPLTAVDRLAALIFEQIQILRGTYGIVTYIAQKL
jgi:SAM-dependent methyltransferase